ncbi:MAG: sulfur oxidation c-type cytochrome SoxX [Nitratireductor sp.]|nr:sulfur oxidation c-type cytochrome SoxX [Nitratireductor sp.]
MKSGRTILGAFAGGIALAVAFGVASAGEMAPGDIKIEDNMVAMSVSGADGNAEEGAAAFKNRGLGNCLACHVNSAMSKELFQGNIGPSLDGVAERYKPEELRAIVVNSKAVFGDETVMPGFYSLDVGKHVREDLVGKTILTSQQVEDIVAYLTTLK